MQERKLGYMDLDGNIAIEPRYDRGGEFAEGLAAVQLEGLSLAKMSSQVKSLKNQQHPVRN